MKTNRPDISQIRKYLDGELDARAMYELERQAQGDPLLMDLLTGMESADGEVHEANLSSIDRQIRERVEQEQKKRAVSWRTLAVAVSVLWGLAFVGLWLLQEPREKQLIVESQKTSIVSKTNQKAQPLIGWEGYRRYLKENAISAQGKGGQVVLAFQIDDQGRPTAIRLVKEASEELNRQAMQLLLNGSKWIREEGHPDKEMQLKVNFE